MNKTAIGLLGLLLLTTALSAFAGDNNGEMTTVITGHVSDESGLPVIGASVLVTFNESVVTGTPTDPEGNFGIELESDTPTNVKLKVSSIVHDTFLLNLDSVLNAHPNRTPRESIRLNLDIQLLAATHDIGTITVSSTESATEIQQPITSATIGRAARQSLIPTNVAGALKAPEITRQGSNHSSHVRINGTSPLYYLNGISIGYDPDHYGMFTIIPASALDQIEVHPQ